MKYYSEKLHKIFDDEESLTKAEKAEEEKNAVVLKSKEDRQKDVDEVKKAAEAYLELLEKNKKLREELREKEDAAYNEYKEQLANFSKKHKNYHLSYVYDGKNIEFKVEENRYNSVVDYVERRNNLIQKVINDLFCW